MTIHDPQNPFLSLLAARRSVAPLNMTGPGPTPAQVDTLLAIGARVPDHGKLAPWRFILFEGQARLAAGRHIAAAFHAANPGADADRLTLESKRLAHAPLVIGVVSRAAAHVKIPEWEQVLSAGAVCMNLVVAANAMGFSACWLTEWYSYDRRALEPLGIGATEKAAGFIHIGRPINPPEERVRPVMSEIVSRYVG